MQTLPMELLPLSIVFQPLFSKAVWPQAKRLPEVWIFRAKSHYDRITKLNGLILIKNSIPGEISPISIQVIFLFRRCATAVL